MLRYFEKCCMEKFNKLEGAKVVIVKNTGVEFHLMISRERRCYQRKLLLNAKI